MAEIKNNGTKGYKVSEKKQYMQMERPVVWKIPQGGKLRIHKVG